MKGDQEIRLPGEGNPWGIRRVEVLD